MHILKDMVIGSFFKEGNPFPKPFFVKSPHSHYINYATGNHGRAEKSLASIEDSWKTIDVAVALPYQDENFPQPHTQINLMEGTQVKVEPPEANISSNEDVLKVVPPAVVILNLADVVDSVITQVKLKVY
ncbi:hypothetical protein KBD75_01840 [Candidatus Woesebacteria bacterium]|nr:hypothetical protein [Candidatus Woesebacteria bacterium]